MNSIIGGWFSEVNDLWPGQAFSLKVDKVLFDEKSAFQHILVFENWVYGRVLVLDGVIQCTQKDEFSYQEMLVHPAMFTHPNPCRVLVVGGGDGGVLREVLKHPEVEHVDVCEIDAKVVEVSKKFLPDMAVGFKDPRCHLYVQDGLHFLRDCGPVYDVIITDSSDPIGPASGLFEKAYYDLLKGSLMPGGIVCSQGECLWLHLDLIRKMLEFCRGLFPSVAYGCISIPTYPCGQIGFFLCGLCPHQSFEQPLRQVTDEQLLKFNFRYYSADVHRASFCLPAFAVEALKREKEVGSDSQVDSQVPV